MKIALVQSNYYIGNFEWNAERIIQGVRKAKSEGADLVVFPELSVTGYPPRDFLEFNDFLNQTKTTIDKIAVESKGIGIIVGAPIRNESLIGKNLFNAAIYMYDGEIVQTAAKSLLPTYDIFDEYRYFEPAKEFKCIQHQTLKIALVVCEDSWDTDDDPLYTHRPLDTLMKENPNLIINISASPFSYAHSEKRKKMLEWNTLRYKVPMIYVNHVGAHTDLIFDGGSMVFNAQGELAVEMNYFEEDFVVVETNQLKAIPSVNQSKTEKIYHALVLGIRDYFSKLGFEKATLGLSGGIDSAVTAALAVQALGKDNVHGVLIPSQYSSDHSVEDAKQLALNLGIRYDIIPIKDMYYSFDQSLQFLFKDLKEDVTEENIQARIRGVLLMALANKFKYVLLNTSNKSEAAVGYGTLYGDMCGGISVLGDVYKMEVYELANYINSNVEIIPQNSIVKPPSAELRPGQKDSDSLPEYELLDKILFNYIENRLGPNELIQMGFDAQTVARVLRLVNINEYKRAQTPPILRISDKAFGPGRRMPIVGKYLSAVLIIFLMLFA